LNEFKVNQRAKKVLSTTNKTIQAEQDEKMYRDAKKKDALQRVQYEIDQQAQKMKAVRERMRIKKEQLT
jgi:hypothetical protein